MIRWKIYKSTPQIWTVAVFQEFVQAETGKVRHVRLLGFVGTFETGEAARAACWADMTRQAITETL